MGRQSVEGFPYFLGVNSLSEIATRDDRVCVLNILGSESREVTPVSHTFSGGNVVFGTSPGRRGQVLATKVGDIPVYNNVREGLDDGLTFNTGVVYLPPVRHSRRRRGTDPGEPRSSKIVLADRERLGP